MNGETLIFISTLYFMQYYYCKYVVLTLNNEYKQKRHRK